MDTRLLIESKKNDNTINEIENVKDNRNSIFKKYRNINKTSSI